jgi:hypothetical protein
MRTNARWINSRWQFLLASVTAIITLSVQLGIAQPVYHPIPDSNATWQETSFWLYLGPPMTPVYSWYTVFTDADTIINSNTYTKLLETGAYGAFGPQIFYSHAYRGAMRQDTAAKKVYFIPAGLNYEGLLYDFNLTIGDTLSQSNIGGSENVVLGIDSVLVNNQYHRRWLMAHINWPATTAIDTNYAIIEGIGSTKGIYQFLVPPFESGSELICHSHDNYYYPPWTSCPFYSGITEAESINNLVIYPNPANDKISVICNGTNPEGVYEIFSLEGRMLLSATIPSGRQTHSEIDTSVLPKGVYFIRLHNTKADMVKKGRFVKM